VAYFLLDLKMNKNIIRAAIVLASFSAAAASFADDTVETDSARWSVVATKDAAAALTVQPVGGPVKFKYDPFTQAFTPQGATFQVSIKSDSTADAGFKLDAQLGATSSIKSNNSSSQAGATVELAAGSEVLDATDWVSLVDSNNGTYLNGLEGVDGTSTSSAVTGGTASFVATLVDFKVADGSVAPTVADLPDGSYTGSVEANFRATWSKS
jgi:Fimbrillin MatB